MKKLYTLLLSLILASTLNANNILVENVIITGQNTTDHYSMIQFDLSWENSWRTSSAPSNWDAAWVFVKYRVGSSGNWTHVKLANTGHTAPSGSTIDMGLLTPATAYNSSTNPALGAFIYRNTAGTGTLNLDNVQLRWNYQDNGLDENTRVEVKVFAIEMVYVPQGAFYLGSGGTEQCSFTDGSFTGTYWDHPTIPFSVTSEGAITVAHSAGNLWSNTNCTGSINPLASTFPKGYNAFYSMKYELSQQGYVDFLNSLDRTSQSYRIGTYLAIGITSVTNRYVMSQTTTVSNRNGIRCDATIPSSNPITFYCDLNNNGVGGESNDGQSVACGYLSWADLEAYLDWSGLRPMTELEFEKSCRGTASSVANELAWGNETLPNQWNATGTYTLSNSGASNEIIASCYLTTGNSANGNTTYQNGSIIQGPLRSGIFSGSTGNTGRVTSGATYYGIMEMSGNLWERVIAMDEKGNLYTGVHGDGSLDTYGTADASTWPGLVNNGFPQGVGMRGGSYNSDANYGYVSDRRYQLLFDLSQRMRVQGNGGRGVRNYFSAPTVTTTAMSSITSTSASSGGNVTSDGGLTITARGICWSTAQNPTTADSKTTDGAGTGTFTSALTGLTPMITYYVRAYATNNVGTAYGDQVSFTTIVNGGASGCSDTCTASGTVSDYDGNVYPTVLIGTQTWMAANLKTSRYSNGDPIPYVITNGAWSAAGTDYRRCYYSTSGSPPGNDSTGSYAYNAVYGTLYNWHATVKGTTGATGNNGVQGVCPNGWRVPSDYERTILTNYLGATAGGKLKECGTAHWNSDPGSTNENCFTALPGGNRYMGPNIIRYDGCWWSATKNNSNPTMVYYRNLTSSDPNVFRFDNLMSYGFSVRCIKNEIPTITTDAASAITAISATSGGNVTSDGGAAVTVRGVCWSTSTGPTTALSTKTTDGTGTGTFTSSITGLSATTTYYVRAYATNSVGTAYGTERSFIYLAIGDNYQGGKVAYVDGTGSHGLIAAPSDLGPAEWGCGGILIGTSITIGSGSSNTTAIITACTTSGIAAKLCYDYTNTETGTGVYSDWYLPSLDELGQLCQNKNSIGYTGDWHWSSSENGTSTSKPVQFSTPCWLGNSSKGYAAYVRCVRPF